MKEKRTFGDGLQHGMIMAATVMWQQDYPTHAFEILKCCGAAHINLDEVDEADREMVKEYQAEHCRLIRVHSQAAKIQAKRKVSK